MSAESNSDNKNDLKPHTNTLKTNTIRIKSWRNSLLSKRTPAVIFITIGFFITAFIPAYAVVMDTGNDMPSNNHTDNGPEPATEDEPLNSSTSNAKASENGLSNPDAAALNNSSSNSSKVEVHSVQTYSSSSSPADTSSSSSSLTINGRKVDLPENGTYRETVKTEDSTTSIRAKLDNDSNMSIKINHSTEKEVE